MRADRVNASAVTSKVSGLSNIESATKVVVEILDCAIVGLFLVFISMLMDIIWVSGYGFAGVAGVPVIKSRRHTCYSYGAQRRIYTQHQRYSLPATLLGTSLSAGNFPL